MKENETNQTIVGRNVNDAFQALYSSMQGFFHTLAARLLHAYTGNVSGIKKDVPSQYTRFEEFISATHTRQLLFIHHVYHPYPLFLSDRPSRSPRTAALFVVYIDYFNCSSIAAFLSSYIRFAVCMLCVCVRVFTLQLMTLQRAALHLAYAKSCTNNYSSGSTNIPSSFTNHTHTHTHTPPFSTWKECRTFTILCCPRNEGKNGAESAGTTSKRHEGN